MFERTLNKWEKKLIKQVKKHNYFKDCDSVDIIKGCICVDLENNGMNKLRLKMEKKHYDKMNEDEQGLMIFVEEENDYICSQNFGCERGIINNYERSIHC